MATHPDMSLEAAMRMMHPFPIFERWVDTDVVVRGETVVEAAGPGPGPATPQEFRTFFPWFFNSTMTS